MAQDEVFDHDGEEDLSEIEGSDERVNKPEGSSVRKATADEKTNLMRTPSHNLDGSGVHFVRMALFFFFPSSHINRTTGRGSRQI